MYIYIYRVNPEMRWVKGLTLASLYPFHPTG